MDAFQIHELKPLMTFPNKTNFEYGSEPQNYEFSHNDSVLFMFDCTADVAWNVNQEHTSFKTRGCVVF